MGCYCKKGKATPVKKGEIDIARTFNCRLCLSTKFHHNCGSNSHTRLHFHPHCRRRFSTATAGSPWPWCSCLCSNHNDTGNSSEHCCTEPQCQGTFHDAQDSCTSPPKCLDSTPIPGRFLDSAPAPTGLRTVSFQDGVSMNRVSLSRGNSSGKTSPTKDRRRQNLQGSGHAGNFVAGCFVCVRWVGKSLSEGGFVKHFCPFVMVLCDVSAMDSSRHVNLLETTQDL